MSQDVRLRMSILIFSLYTLLFCQYTSAFYIPGYSIRTYRKNENIPLLVNKVYSDNTQLQYAYFDLPFVCPPSGHRKDGSRFASGHSLSLNLGEVLRGDRITASDFEINMLQDVPCEYVCDRIVGRQDVKWAQDLIEEGYLTEWIFDNLPGATSFVTVDKQRKYYSAGFKLGYKDYDVGTGQPIYYLNNHYTMVIRWRKAPGRAGDKDEKVIVGFEVYPRSINAGQRNITGCPADVFDDHEPLALSISPNETYTKYPDSSYTPKDQIDQNDGATMTIPYTYSVYFREDNDIEWANRWDHYFSDQAEGSFTHWLAIVNSLIISGILGVVCIVIWTRTSQDIKMKGDGLLEEAKLKRGEGGTGLEKPELSDDEDEILDDNSGWKLLHGDVFRSPRFGGILAPLIGSGSQLIFMFSGILLLSCFGILNPSWRGGFISVGIGLFVFAGLFSGYFSARVYKTFGGQNWRKNTLVTAMLFPGLLFTFLFVLNLFTWAQASSTAIPFSTLIAIACLWLLIQVPLVHVGSYYGFYRCNILEHPTRTNTIQRQIPQNWYNKNRLLLAVAAGSIPFAVLFIELLFVFKSLYLDKSSYYYVFGFLSIISALLTITIAETVIVTTYIQLCAENYHWWWQSFMVGGSSSLWIFTYSIWYYWTKLHINGFISSLLFFSYSALACTVYGLATGTIGFIAAYTFVRRIYRGVKVD